MRTIPLRDRTGAIVAEVLVDDADYEWLSQWRWSLHRGARQLYAERHEGTRRNKRTIRMHRQIAGLQHGDGRMVDHRNRNGLDNRRENLRIAGRGDRDNKQNLDPYRTNTSGARGVTRRGDRYIAQATVNYKAHYLGMFATLEEADAVVRAFRRERMPFSQEAAA